MFEVALISVELFIYISGLVNLLHLVYNQTKWNNIKPSKRITITYQINNGLKLFHFCLVSNF